MTTNNFRRVCRSDVDLDLGRDSSANAHDLNWTLDHGCGVFHVRGGADSVMVSRLDLHPDDPAPDHERAFNLNFSTQDSTQHARACLFYFFAIVAAGFNLIFFDHGDTGRNYVRISNTNFGDRDGIDRYRRDHHFCYRGRVYFFINPPTRESIT